MVSGNSINFIRAGNLNIKLLIPYLIGSIPFSFIGGSIYIEKEFFEILLFAILLIAGFFLLIESKSFSQNEIKINNLQKIFSIIIGCIIGFVSGLIGIGGGIFLSPILFLMKAGYPKHITSCASLFILINSICLKRQYKIGLSSSSFLIFYGIFRIVAEQFREPDTQLGYVFGNLSMGTILSFIMVISGFIILINLRKKNEI